MKILKAFYLFIIFLLSIVILGCDLDDPDYEYQSVKQYDVAVTSIKPVDYCVNTTSCYHFNLAIRNNCGFFKESFMIKLDEYRLEFSNGTVINDFLPYNSNSFQENYLQGITFDIKENVVKFQTFLEVNVPISSLDSNPKLYVTLYDSCEKTSSCKNKNPCMMTSNEFVFDLNND